MNENTNTTSQVKMINLRVSAGLKEKAEKVFRENNLSTTKAMRYFLEYVSEKGYIPFGKYAPATEQKLKATKNTSYLKEKEMMYRLHMIECISSEQARLLALMDTDIDSQALRGVLQKIQEVLQAVYQTGPYHEHDESYKYPDDYEQVVEVLAKWRNDMYKVILDAHRQAMNDLIESTDDTERITKEFAKAMTTIVANIRKGDAAFPAY